jgi:hypothetical protein
MAPKRDTACLSSGVGDGHGYRNERISAEPAFVRRSIQLYQGAINLSLIGSLSSPKGWRDLVAQSAQGPRHIVAAECGPTIALI